MTSVFTIKLTHLTTGAEKLIPINDEEFKTLIASPDWDDKSYRVFAEIIARTSLVQDWFDQYEFNGIFLGTVRKDRT